MKEKISQDWRLYQLAEGFEGCGRRGHPGKSKYQNLLDISLIVD